MISRVKYGNFFELITVFFSTFIRFLLNALVIIISFALIIGVSKSGIDLFHSIHEPLEIVLRHMLLDIVFIVALVEIMLVILGYLKDGAVHVRYIVDTILIIMLNEIVTVWFKGASLQDSVGLALIILTLAAVRVSVVRWGPNSNTEMAAKK